MKTYYTESPTKALLLDTPSAIEQAKDIVGDSAENWAVKQALREYDCLGFYLVSYSGTSSFSFIKQNEFEQTYHE